MKRFALYAFAAAFALAGCKGCSDSSGTTENNDTRTDPNNNPLPEGCDDLDGDGWGRGLACEGQVDCNDEAPEANPGGTEVCGDGLDNDCDGTVDNDCPSCEDGATQACGTDEGACTAGTQTCEGGVWSVCDGVGPGTEECNGLDDDCDGDIDEDPDQICDNGLACDGVETCSAGQCVPGTPPDCSEFDTPCSVGECSEKDGGCLAYVSPDGDACADGTFCTIDGVCQDGECVGTPRDCSGEDDQCNTGRCDEAAGACVKDPVVDDTTCDDGLFCTENDSCQGGVCSGPARDCSAVDDQCNTGMCDDTADMCVTVTAADGDPCDDGMFCTEMDTCQAGLCTAGVPRDCSFAGDQCNDGVCDETTDGCVPDPLPLGTLCDDGQFCTTNDTCVSGACQPGIPTDCSGATGGDTCLVGMCDVAAQMCTTMPNPTCCDVNLDADLDGFDECADCNDSDGSVNPNGMERCNGVDDDCDGLIDEDFDADNDGYATCSTDPDLRDCNDADGAVNPGMAESCDSGDGLNTGNGKDDDCDGYVDEGCNPCTTTDVDGDGSSECDGDCDDNDPVTYPGATELCDGKDNDCNVFTTPNCGVSQDCNHDGDGDFANDPDICADDMLCAEVISGRPGGNNSQGFKCTSFCNSSETGPLGDGCEQDQTCSLDLFYSANVHGCSVNTEIPGTLGGGEACSQETDCRSLFCEKPCIGGRDCNQKYCRDQCTRDSECGANAVCRIQQQTNAALGHNELDGVCWPAGGPFLGAAAVGDACSGNTAAGNTTCDHGWCAEDPVDGSEYCTQPCCSAADCDTGYTCGFMANGFDTNAVYPPPSAASCNVDADCTEGDVCFQGQCAWRVQEQTPVCIKQVPGMRVAGQVCAANSDCASNFCDQNLGICVELCCADSTCPSGLGCELQFIETTTDRATQARVCVNLSTDEVWQRM